ncbi:MAG TPA: hypothetical protein VFR79_01270, partial [Nitrospira sp.]|nr:hypothetical protein [Nitrospira sp.]
FLEKFDPNEPDPEDLRGGKRAARRFVDWQTFFKFKNNSLFRPNKKSDAKLVHRPDGTARFTRSRP